jgi:hypothetical protein
MSTIILGVGFIAIGFLINLFPNLIAGFDTLSQKERENAKINGLSRFMLIGFSTMGVVIIAGHYIANFLEEPSLSKNLNLLVILSGAVILIVFGQKFKTKDPKNFQENKHTTVCNLNCCLSKYALQSNRICKYCVKR